MVTQKQIKEMLQNQLFNQAKIVEENNKLEQAQANRISELKVELTAKDEELSKALKAAKEAHDASVRALSKKEEDITRLQK